MTSLSTYSPSVGIVKRNPNLEMFLQPCKDEKTYYRLRLIGPPSNVGRTDPHIVRHVHKIWITDPATGKKRLEKLTCVANTPWIETEGPKKSSCKICAYAAHQWAIYNESSKSDPEARIKASRFSSYYEAIVPVYVKNDPNYERNNGKLRVIVFDNKKFYEGFRTILRNKLKDVNIFNGTKGVDLLLHVGVNEVSAKNGKVYRNPVVDKIKFSTDPYEIPAINEKLIESFPYDETYYTKPDQEEIDAFYDKYCVVVNDDIPEDDEIPVYSTDKKLAASAEKIPTNDVPSDDISDADIDEVVNSTNDASDDPLASDPDNEGLDVKPIANESASSTDIDEKDILADLGI